MPEAGLGVVANHTQKSIAGLGELNEKLSAGRALQSQKASSQSREGSPAKELLQNTDYLATLVRGRPIKSTVHQAIQYRASVSNHKGLLPVVIRRCDEGCPRLRS